MNPEEKLGYRTKTRRRKRLLVLLSYSKSFGFRLKRAFFFKHPQYITELFSYNFRKKGENKKRVT